MEKHIISMLNLFSMKNHWFLNYLYWVSIINVNCHYMVESMHNLVLLHSECFGYGPKYMVANLFSVNLLLPKYFKNHPKNPIKMHVSIFLGI